MMNLNEISQSEKLDRLTVHMDGIPVYDIVMAEDFSDLADEVKKYANS